MAIVNGNSGDFIHRAGDGRTVPPGYVDVIGVTTGNDTINGFGGDDILFGDFGNDTLDGGPGADAMDGGPGTDIYVVDNTGDTATEGPG